MSQKENKESKDHCYFCGAEEGKPRKLGQFIVALQEVELKSGKVVMACQSCSVHEKKKLKSREQKKKSVIKRIRAYFS